MVIPILAGLGTAALSLIMSKSVQAGIGKLIGNLVKAQPKQKVPKPKKAKRGITYNF
jgi:hypothetical protein